MSGPQQRSARLLGMDLVIPGDWWRVPLRDAHERKTSVRRLLQRQLAGVDHTPALRHRLEAAIDDVAGDAADAGGIVLWFSTALISGFPLSITLVLTSTRHAAIDDVREALDPADDVDSGALRSGRVLRRVSVRDQSRSISGLLDATPGGTGSLTAEQLREAGRVLVADYWIQRPWGGLVHLAFSSPLVPLREPLVELFDTVVDTILWRDDPADQTADGGGDAAGTS